MSYVELHARSAFSFLRGASNPEDLAKAATALELPGLALLDRDGVYGAPRLYAPAREFGLRPLVGAELTMEDGTVVPLLVANRTGYQNLCQLITEAKLVERQSVARVGRGGMADESLFPPCSPEQGHDPHAPDPRDRKRPCFATWEELARHSDGLIALTGDEEGPVRTAWRNQGDAAAADALQTLRRIFGSDRLYVELQRQRIRGEDHELRFLVDLATAHEVPIVATGGVNYAVKSARMVADVFTCLRLHTTLDAAGRQLSANDQRHLKSARQMRELFRDLPGAVDNSVRLAERLEFTLEKLGYQFPTYTTPNGESMDAYLREITFAAAPKRVGTLSAALVAQLNRELELIGRLKFSGYFLIVWDICRWARERGILVQGRGSAANSAVCYVLGITAVNPVRHHLLFDRFLNDSRIGPDGNPSWPDIDLDLPSGERRESVIQEVYQRYGRRGAAMTANVITYRGRSVIREAGKVLGFGDDALDRFSSLYANGDFPQTLQLQQQLAMSGIAPNHPRAALLSQVYDRVHGLPRHLGQHSGGMVICQGQLDKVVPLEPATMPDRTVCQWDKDDCENLGIVKIDFLGLGMMAVMQDTIELCAKRPDGPRALDDIPEEDPFTYEKIRAADTVGVFQIESRAQMATLPRFKPKNLYDLAMQVALVRPGPITGHLVHPLIRRRDGLEAEDYIDPSVETLVRPILGRTKGVILFQEQMLELSMTLAKFTGAQAEELRRAMGFTKNADRLNRALAKLADALRREGRSEVVVQKVCDSAQSFAAYGFPESHAIGFAMLAYASTWLKLHRPAEFYASLLNNQPMGFYSPATLLQDAKREERRVKALPVSVQDSDWICTVVDANTIRIGLRYVKGLREAAVQQMLAARRGRPFASLDDFLARTNFSATDRRALAAAGALNGFTSHRRAAMWAVEAAWSEQEALFKHYAAEEHAKAAVSGTESTERRSLLAGDSPIADSSIACEQAPTSPSFASITGETPVPPESPLAPMTLAERLRADFSHLGLTTGRHPMALLRPRLTDVCTAADLKQVKTGKRVTIAGSVICRQRPGTASGVVFVSLEDETGIANAIVQPQVFEANRLTITQEAALRITGPVQNVANVVHVKAEVIEPLREEAVPAQASHDFH